MKSCKIFYETQTASRLQEIIQPSPNPPPSDKMLLSLWKKNFPTEIYRYIQTFAFKVLQKCIANVFSNTKQKHVGWKTFEVRKVFGCIARAYYFQCQ